MKHARPVVFVALLLTSSPTPAQEAGQDNVWRNPQNSVHVRIDPCGNNRCGVVVWANDKARADSARGGTHNLVGTQLFRDFRQVKPNVWKGKAFVPDLNKSFSGTLTIKNEDTAVAHGCVLIVCKSQTWTRVR